MAIVDVSQKAWAEDITAILGTHKQIGIDLHVLLKNLACHYILEQLIEDPNKKVFDINIAPYGMGKLVIDGDKIEITDIKLYPAFLSTLINTIKTRESNLYRQQYQEVFNVLKRQLKNFSEGRNN